MQGSIRLTAAQRKTVLRIYRGSGDARRARKAHVLLLLDRGESYRRIINILFCSSDLIASLKREFLEDGLEVVLGQSTEQPVIPFWQVIVASWVREKTPQDFGYYRSRWTAGLLADLLEEKQGIKVSAETLRRVLVGSNNSTERQIATNMGCSDDNGGWLQVLVLALNLAESKQTTLLMLQRQTAVRVF